VVLRAIILPMVRLLVGVPFKVVVAQVVMGLQVMLAL
jgi:hypothetical protein